MNITARAFSQIGKSTGRQEESVMTSTVSVTDRAKLGVISDVRTDRTLPKNRRIIEYIRQLNNQPNHYICNGIEVWSKHPPDGPKIEELLKVLVR
jgi:hypothetical protein